MKRLLVILMILLGFSQAAPAAEPTPPTVTNFSQRGIGGGGGIFSPAISPFNPDLLFVACDMSGVYRSTDRGKTWALIPSKHIKGIAAAKSPAFFKDRMYWYTLYSPLVSMDEGITWKKVKWPWRPRRKIQGIKAYNGNRDILFIATKQDLWRLDIPDDKWDMVLKGGCLAPAILGDTIVTASSDRIMSSTDDGLTWKQKAAVGLDKGKILSIAGSSNGDKSLLIASVENKGLFRSTDKGASWTKVAPFDNQWILSIPQNQVDVAWVAEKRKHTGKKLWRSEDGGRSWEIAFNYYGLSKNVEYSWIENDLRWGYFITKTGFTASPTSPDVALLTTQAEVFITEDGGKSWSSLVNTKVGTSPDNGMPIYKSSGLEVTTCYQYQIHPEKQNMHFISYTDIGFARSQDHGKTWSISTKGSPWRNSFYRVRFDPETPKVMYAAAASRHDIPHWPQLGIPWRCKKCNTGGVNISKDYGANWTPLGNGFPEASCTDVIVYMDKENEERILFATAYGKGLFRSRDSGQTWQDITSAFDSENHNFLRLWRNPSTGNLFCLVTALREKGEMIHGGLWKSTDDGESWKDITASSPMDWPNAFYVDPENEKSIYLATASIPGKKVLQGGVWKSEDGGEIWQHKIDRKKLSFAKMMAIAVHPENKNIVLTGGVKNGLWFSIDSGESWKKYDDFPFKAVQGIDFNPQNPDEIFVTTFGSGVWVGPVIPEN